MKLVSFNTNGIRARLHQLEALIATQQPDVIGIQETKVIDGEFPVEAIEAMGYHVEFHGQKGHYGVCLMSKQPPSMLQKGFPDDGEEAQKRLIIGRYPTPDGRQVTVINGYFPQGENIAHPTKFPAKRKFYADLLAHLQAHCDPSELLVVMGDLNISPEDIDIGIGEPNRKRWLRDGKTSFQPEEREWLQRLKDWGLQDTYRVVRPNDDEHFSWFDYRSRGFEREPKRGLRIDTILATAPLCELCADAGIDYDVRGMEKPSDHAPVWATFDL
ncbi:MAG: exodeoxyribonuclease III [Oceanospirillaceae bacterium]|nr:exodeoxyribonuclease III [Oceanospirillaceae bacterium]